ncbi:hypothetical protein JX265_013854 [Neoarthrinium moseri]|uniref:Uncharacterized protein n=1 Tax=Neoarthrinium moseri TaxID=1658444 RepID=A0A9P9W7W1_9PEZI|nr:hypothetical protein JX265_013854 [Neoarthrinium moseri]
MNDMMIKPTSTAGALAEASGLPSGGLASGGTKPGGSVLGHCGLVTSSSGSAKSGLTGASGAATKPTHLLLLAADSDTCRLLQVLLVKATLNSGDEHRHDQTDDLARQVYDQLLIEEDSSYQGLYYEILVAFFDGPKVFTLRSFVPFSEAPGVAPLVAFVDDIYVDLLQQEHAISLLDVADGKLDILKRDVSYNKQHELFNQLQSCARDLKRSENLYNTASDLENECFWIDSLACKLHDLLAAVNNPDIARLFLVAVWRLSTRALLYGHIDAAKMMCEDMYTHSVNCNQDASFLTDRSNLILVRGLVYMGLGQFDVARGCFSGVINYKSLAKGPEDHKTILARRCLAAALMLKGRHSPDWYQGVKILQKIHTMTLPGTPRNDLIRAHCVWETRKVAKGRHLQWLNQFLIDRERIVSKMWATADISNHDTLAPEPQDDANSYMLSTSVCNGALDGQVSHDMEMADAVRGQVDGWSIVSNGSDEYQASTDLDDSSDDENSSHGDWVMI